MPEYNDYGICLVCGNDLVPQWAIIEESKIVDGHLYHTGKRKRICDYLFCPVCGDKQCVDDSFDEYI